MLKIQDGGRPPFLKTIKLHYYTLQRLTDFPTKFDTVTQIVPVPGEIEPQQT